MPYRRLEMHIHTFTVRDALLAGLERRGPAALIANTAEELSRPACAEPLPPPSLPSMPKARFDG